MIKFSILTPWLPPRQTIHNTISHIDNQTYQNWEHLITIDRFGHSLESHDERRRIIPCEEEHKLWGNPCRHNMWAEATGDWIIYLDDDDVLYPGALEIIANAIIGQQDKDWGYFQILLGGNIFFHIPPMGGLITGGQIFHRKVGLDGTEYRWFDTTNMAADWDFVYQYFVAEEKPPILIHSLLGELPQHNLGRVYE
jgi:glycosyltransferase involved in cell wall biosynthesis